MKRLSSLFTRHKPRVARLLALAGLFAIATVLLPHVPRPVDVELELGPLHADVTNVRFDYLQDGEEVHGVAFSFPKGAPERVRHTVKLPAGEFELQTEARHSDGQIATARYRLHSPTADTVSIRMQERSH